MFKDSKSFEKVVTLDCQDYRCLEQGIMTYIILGLERAFIMDFYLLGIMLQFPINIWPKRPFCGESVLKPTSASGIRPTVGSGVRPTPF